MEDISPLPRQGVQVVGRGLFSLVQISCLVRKSGSSLINNFCDFYFD